MYSLADFDAIVFDLGGVIINLDYHATIRAFSDLYECDFSSFFTQKQQMKAFDELETGAISGQEFRDRINAHFGYDVPNDSFDRAWNAMLLDFPVHRLELLKNIRSKMPIFLLSNTNEIHKPVFEKALKDTHGYASLDYFFAKAYYSHEMGDRKPNPSIFQTVLQENSLRPERTLFIDDSAQHIASAKNLGIVAHHLVPGQDIGALFVGL